MNRVPAAVLAGLVIAAAALPGGCATPAEKADQAMIRQRPDPGAEAIGIRVAGPGAPAGRAPIEGEPVKGRGPGLSPAPAAQPPAPAAAPVQVAQVVRQQAPAAQASTPRAPSAITASSSAASAGAADAAGLAAPASGGADHGAPAPAARPAAASPASGVQARDGIVVAVRGESVYVDLGRDDGIAVGQRLRVVRPGAPLVHPVTGETLGSVDDEVAQLEVTSVAEKFSTSRIVRIAEGAAIEPKDRVVPAAAAVAGGAAGEAAPGAAGPGAAAPPAGAGATGGLPAAAASDGAARSTQAAGRTPAAGAEGAAPGAAQGIPLGVALDPGRAVVSQELGYEIRDLAVADLDGDGRVELITIDQFHLAIYRWTGRSLELLFEEEETNRREYISVDAADLDGDGRAELLVNDAFGQRVQAAILRQDGRRFVRTSLPRDHYFRIIGAEVGAPTLVGQRRGDSAQPFVGDVHRYEWRGGKARRGDVLWTPVRTSIFDIQLYRTPDGKIELAAWSPTGHLRLFSGREEVWSSQQEFDGTKLRVAEKNMAPPKSTAGEMPVETPIPGRILPLSGVTGRSGDPIPAFVLRRNEKSSLIAPRYSFSKGTVAALAVEGPVTRELWRTDPYEGYVAACRVADLGPVAGGAGGRALVVALDLQKGLFKAARSVLVVQPLR